MTVDRTARRVVERRNGIESRRRSGDRGQASRKRRRNGHADCLMSYLSLGHTVVLGIGFSARRASEKVKAGRRSVRYCFVDASCSFTFDALPAGSLGRAYLRCSHLRLPLSLNLVQLTLLFALSWLTQG
jgi:hypothetical protein